MIPPVKHIVIATALSFTLSSLTAQTVKPGTKTTPVQKFKPPKMKTTWGGHTDSASISVKDGLQLVVLPVKITDDKNNVYTISSYQFVWKRRVVTEDETTGKVSPASSMQTQLFRATPLPELWTTSISQQLKKGEEFLLLDVVVKDAQGRFMFAPNLKIKIN